jgi:serine/threonine protein phosphatase PrpC
LLRVTEHFQLSDTGRERRANEDSMFVKNPVFVVADGMGGAQAGEIASRVAVEAFHPGLGGVGTAEQRLAERVREANLRIHDMARADERRAGMGTTITAAFVGDGGVSIAHVGDSRAYLFRDGQLSRLSRDHSLVGELVRRGKLTEEQAEEHPQRSIITRALGPEAEVAVDTVTQPTQAGDIFLLCSDGLTTMLSEQRLADILAAGGSLEEIGHELVDEANAAGGRDNITVVLFRIDDVEGDEPLGEDTADVDQPTMVTPGGAVAPQPAGESAAAAAPGGGAADQTMVLPATRAPARKARVRRAEERSRRRSRGRARALGFGLVVIALIGILVAAGWFATRAVYFVGTNDQGFITVYRGLPYELPFGVDLYEESYTSSVSALQVPQAQRDRLLDQQLRSEDDAIDLVRAIELGQLESPTGRTGERTTPSQSEP